MTLLGGMVCQFAIFACHKWGNNLHRSTNYCIVCWLSWWTGSWMLQVTDHMEASSIFYVKVRMLDQLEKSKSFILTITWLGIALLTVQHNIIFARLSYTILQMPSDKPHPTLFPLSAVLLILIKHPIPAVLHFYLSQWTIRQYQTG